MYAQNKCLVHTTYVEKTIVCMEEISHHTDTTTRDIRYLLIVL